MEKAQMTAADGGASEKRVSSDPAIGSLQNPRNRSVSGRLASGIRTNTRKGRATMRETKRMSRKIALCGLMAAVGILIMLLGSLILVGTYSGPALAGIVLIPVIFEYGNGTALLLYAALSCLSLILLPDREMALLFLFLGWYPVARGGYNRLKRKTLSALLKFVTFNAVIAVMYGLLIFVFRLTELTAEYRACSFAVLAISLFLGNVTFFTYDVALGKLTVAYRIKLRPKLGRLL